MYISYCKNQEKKWINQYWIAINSFCKENIKTKGNNQKDIFKYMEDPSEFFYGCDYVCFLYTILEPTMAKKPTDDELFVEETSNNSTATENILYVD